MTAKPVVLVVDDTPANIDILVDTLKESYQVRAATNGELALALTQKLNPDIILLDIMMPGIDGFEVCRRLKAQLTTRHIPIIFVTAMIALEDEVRGLQLGAVDYITKPINPAIVKARVQTHLALALQNRALEEKVQQRTKELEETRLQVVQRLGRAAEYKDNETGLHVIRMSYFTYELALAAGMSEPDARTLMHAAPMHDIGKIGIPDHILKKPGRLTDEEMAIMRTHATIGGEIIGETESELMRVAKEIALTHHEKWDGSGYPSGLAGEDIPESGRITAIADVFDALTSERPYKKPWSVEQAVNFLQENAGSHFDPRLVSLFVDKLDRMLEIKETYAENKDT